LARTQQTAGKKEGEIKKADVHNKQQVKKEGKI
jgi:hypothetical protein